MEQKERIVQKKMLQVVLLLQPLTVQMASLRG